MAAPEVADEARPRVKPDAELDHWAVGGPPVVVHAEHDVLHVEGRTHRAGLVRGARQRGVPHGHDAVPDELVDGAAAAHDLVAHLLEVLAADLRCPGLKREWGPTRRHGGGGADKFARGGGGGAIKAERGCRLVLAGVRTDSPLEGILRARRGGLGAHPLGWG